MQRLDDQILCNHNHFTHFFQSRENNPSFHSCKIFSSVEWFLITLQGHHVVVSELSLFETATFVSGVRVGIGVGLRLDVTISPFFWKLRWNSRFGLGMACTVSCVGLIYSEAVGEAGWKNTYLRYDIWRLFSQQTTLDVEHEKQAPRGSGEEERDERCHHSTA